VMNSSRQDKFPRFSVKASPPDRAFDHGWQYCWLILTLLTLLTSLFAVGCASIPAGKYQALRTSGDEILTDTVGTFGKVEIMQRHYRVVVAPDSPLTTNSFEPAVVAGRSTDIVPALRFREDALRTLVKYLTVLEAFSAKDYETAVDKASIDLAGSLQNLNASAGAMPSGEFKNATGVNINARERIFDISTFSKTPVKRCSA